jgi:hypothetical protein
MQHFETIDKLIESIAGLKQEQWIFANIESWKSNPRSTDFYYIPWDYLQTLEDNEVFVDDDELELPASLKEKHLKEWMLVNVLSHIADKAGSSPDKASNFIDMVN